MRTTVDIADDVLFAAKDFARRDKKTLGEVLTDWGRIILQNPQTLQAPKKSGKKQMAESEIDRKFREMGFVTFPSRKGGGVATNEMINRIREEEGI